VGALDGVLRGVVGQQVAQAAGGVLVGGPDLGGGQPGDEVAGVAAEAADDGAVAVAAARL
jgi:hypothetical protein